MRGQHQADQGADCRSDNGPGANLDRPDESLASVVQAIVDEAERAPDHCADERSVAGVPESGADLGRRRCESRELRSRG